MAITSLLAVLLSGCGGAQPELKAGTFELLSGTGQPYAYGLSSAAPGFAKGNDSTRVVTPHVLVKVNATAHGGTVEDDAAEKSKINDGKGFSAPAGHTARMAVVSLSQGPYPRPETLPTLKIVAGKKTSNLTYDDVRQRKYYKLTAIVKKGDPFELQITDDGRTIRLNLATGLPVEDAAGKASKIYTTTRKVEGLGKTTTLKATHGMETQLSLDNSRVQLQPWLNGLGWAPEGKAWLSLGLYPHSSPPSGTSMIGASMRAERSFSITPEGGTPITARKGNVDTNSFSTKPKPVVFEVPASFTKGTLTIKPTGNATLFAGYTTKTFKFSTAEGLKLPIDVSP